MNTKESIMGIPGLNIYKFKDLLLVDDPHTDMGGAKWMRDILAIYNPEFYLIESDLDFSDISSDTQFIGVNGRVEVDLEYALKTNIKIIPADPYQSTAIADGLSYMPKDLQIMDSFDAVKRLYDNRKLDTGFENFDDFYSSIHFAQIISLWDHKRESGMIDKILGHINMRSKESPVVARFGMNHIDRLVHALNEYDIDLGRIGHPNNYLNKA
jgi:hypothetical protein